MKRFDGATAFITGGGGGIGSSIARALAEAGAVVIIADVDDAAAQEVVRTLNERAGRFASAHAVHLDVTDSRSWTDALAFVRSINRDVDIFINNAGVSGNVNTPVEALSAKEWDWVRRINLDGVLNGLRAVVPHMKAHGRGGHIVNTGSIASLVTFPAIGDYAATKYGVAAFSETLREELRPFGIGVSLLCPGSVRTSVMENSRRARLRALEIPASPLSSELQAALEGGLPSDVVGPLVLSAIRDDRPYIFTHPHLKGQVEERVRRIMEDFEWAARAQEILPQRPSP